ncbi:receptor-interacting serine/threonine-protein kinase 3-like isoform X2 [Myripristis murdjan]|uniref:receptor-interacting serine/threonine-protein kinase 3-like isoform X2 n=1 Tax=Myripristis murdjan TaxID=586833 RepID=UPI0011761C1F|nr:receptor-interacting serine/threonine-protein kinase 3-like isoform X2 [Myripristis murdjan]
MALPSHKAKLIEDESLEDWQLIGSGGFGQVYKARYKTLKIDVAIKLSRYCEGSIRDEALQREASHLVKADSPFVLQVFGLYQGCPPDMGSDMQMGIVMEFMERGTLRSLLQLCRPPWPLAFRLAHQVALGMNFLHEIAHLLHTDLKPSNVLLDQSLNAKLADFGLSNSSTDTTVLEGGTLAYTAPEAFAETYQPVPAYDIYSYGILLWSILTGKEPYPDANTSRVELWTAGQNKRPPCDEINRIQADGISELADLMVKCWDREPSNRPPFIDCLDVTECVYSRHKNGIRDAVNQVLMKLESGNNHLPSYATAPSSLSQPPAARSNDTVDYPNFARSEDASTMDSVDPVKLRIEDKGKFVDTQRAKLIQLTSMVMPIIDDLGNMVHPEAYSRIEAKTTDQEKMRELYKTLRSGGLKVKAAFYDALCKNEPLLLENLSSS